MTAGAFFDVDGTIVRGNLAVAGALDWVRRGRIRPLDFARGAAWFWGNYLAGRMNYGDLTRVGFFILAGQSAQSIQDDAADILDRRVRNRIYAQALVHMQTHRDAGRRLVVASSAPAPMVRALAARVGINDIIVTELETHDGILTGQVVGELCYGEGKRKLVQAFADRHGLSLSDSFAYADGYTDIPFLSSVGHPVAVNPDRRLRREAVKRAWPIVRYEQEGE
ncbi:MAG: HAD family hydrolase [Nitrospirae bacterium]|nr:HAD family hydrolase [Nitrospirota bacterium]